MSDDGSYLCSASINPLMRNANDPIEGIAHVRWQRGFRRNCAPGCQAARRRFPLEIKFLMRLPSASLSLPYVPTF